MIRQLIKKVIPRGILQILRRVLPSSVGPSVSAHYQILAGPPPDSAAATGAGWAHPDVAQKQHRAFEPLLRELMAGRPRRDFQVLAASIQRTQMRNPSILEIGCGSGWNCRVLELLYAQPFTYSGLDCSDAMLDIARGEFPRASFRRGDAVATPFQDGVCDILISGTVLMHLADYRAAIREARRLASHWCVFHTVPITSGRPTTFLRKLAYGQPTVEIIFNEAELLGCFSEAGLTVEAVFESLDYDLEAVLGEPTRTRTYLCVVSP